MREKKLIVIAGPTASGKTALGIALAGHVDGEIVSADSMQIYRGMDVGTAKATAEEQAAAKHHMLDLIEPGENYSVSRYVEDATQVCEDLFRRGKQNRRGRNIQREHRFKCLAAAHQCVKRRKQQHLWCVDMAGEQCLKMVCCIQWR